MDMGLILLIIAVVVYTALSVLTSYEEEATEYLSARIISPIIKRHREAKGRRKQAERMHMLADLCDHDKWLKGKVDMFIMLGYAKQENCADNLLRFWYEIRPYGPFNTSADLRRAADKLLN